jgi:hypothetical protein
VFTWGDGRKYDGQYKDGKMHGKGVETTANGEKYDGDWKDDKRHGQGVLTAVRHDGEWRDGKPHGATRAGGEEGYSATWLATAIAVILAGLAAYLRHPGWCDPSLLACMVALLACAVACLCLSPPCGGGAK